MFYCGQRGHSVTVNAMTVKVNEGEIKLIDGTFESCKKIECKEFLLKGKNYKKYRLT